jgi:hypothetical protein
MPAKKSLIYLIVFLVIALVIFAAIFYYIQNSLLEPKDDIVKQKTMGQILRENITAPPGESQIPDKVMKDLTAPGQEQNNSSSIINNLTAPK